MTDSQIRSIVRSEIAALLRGLLAAAGESPRGGSPPKPDAAQLAALLAALPVGASMTASQLRLLIPVELRSSPTHTGQLLAKAVGRVEAGRILRKLRSDRGCSLYRLEPVAPAPPPPADP